MATPSTPPQEISFTDGATKYNLTLKVAFESSGETVTIEGRNYQIVGSEESISSLRKHMAIIKPSNLTSLKSFQAFLAEIGSTEKTISVFEKAIVRHERVADEPPKSAALSLDKATHTSAPAEAVVRGTIIKGEKGKEIDILLTSIMVTQHLSGSVRIVKNSEVILQKGYGNAREGCINTPETIFRLASISKTLTATVILRLQDKGKLNTKDPLSKHLPFIQEKITSLKEQLSELKKQERLGLLDTTEIVNKIAENIKQTKWLESITIEHLMKHKSGLPDLSEAAPDEIVSFQLGQHDPIEYINKLKNKPIKFEPGTEKNYNNFGYMLLAQIAENVSSKSYEHVMKEEVFTPLEMSRSHSPIRETDDRPDAHSFTLVKFKRQNLEGYIQWLEEEIAKSPEDDRLKALNLQKSECNSKLRLLLTKRENDKVPDEHDHCSVRLGSGNINSNLLDLAKLEAALSKPEFLSEHSQTLMNTEGYGWDLCGRVAEEAILGNKEVQKGDRGWTMKDGELGGSHTMIWRFPDMQTSIIMLCNSDMDNEERGYLGPLSIQISKLLLNE